MTQPTTQAIQQARADEFGTEYLLDDHGRPIEVGGGDVLAIIENIPQDRNLAFAAGWNSCRLRALSVLASEREALEARVKVLEAAIKPFASDELIANAEARNQAGITNFGRACCLSYSTTLGSLYDARAALNGATRP